MVGHAITFALSIVLARGLGVEGFEAFVVAAAAFVLMLNIAPLGLDKYAIRLLPALFESRDWGGAAGFVRFSVRRVVGASLTVMAVATLWILSAADAGSDRGRALLASVLSLPAAALVQLLAGVTGAAGGERRANLIARVGVPLCTLGLAGVALAAPIPFSGATAIACWGVSWVVAALWLRLESVRRLPAEALAARPLEDAGWGAQARVFWAYGIAMALMGQAGIVALEMLQPSASAVGAYGAAMSTAAAFVATVAATNGLYARQLSVLMERRDGPALQRLRRERLRWLLPLIAAFLATVFVFSGEILGLFRPEFVAEGIGPIRILAVGVSVTLVFALSPTYLKYRQRNRELSTIVAASAALQMVLLAGLVPRRGATGAAMAYALSTCVMYSAFAAMRYREMGRIGG